MEWNGVEAILASTEKKSSPRGSILDKEIIRMKFNKDIVITNELMDGEKIFTNVRHMKYITKRHIFI